ncbi:hypothetical protein [Flavobacterium sp.]|nr:hypothetical protein [Flavobacterium sp.]
MKSQAKIKELLHAQNEYCNQAIAKNVGKLYVRIYDCMMVMRLFM